MPRKYFKYRRRRKRRSNTLHIGKSLMPGFPATKSVKMRYCDIFQLNPGAGTTATYFYRANSIFDPQYSVGGHQPLGRDEWEPFYNHYVVRSASINVKMIWQDTTTNKMTISGIYLSDDVTVPTTALQLIEQGKGVYKVGMDNINSGINPLVLNNKFNAKTFFNITDLKDNLDRLGALMTTDPAEEAYFCIYTANADGSDGGVVQCLVSIIYDVVFSEPKALVQS